MNRDDHKGLLIFLAITVCLYIILGYYFASKKSEERIALDECVEEVATNCKGLYNYAVSLEEENARLNRLCRESR